MRGSKVESHIVWHFPGIPIGLSGPNLLALNTRLFCCSSVCIK